MSTRVRSGNTLGFRPRGISGFGAILWILPGRRGWTFFTHAHTREPRIHAPAARTPMNTRRTLLAALAVAVLATACAHRGGAGGRVRGQASPNPIPTATAKVTTVHATSTISGVIAPLLNVAITSALSEPADASTSTKGTTSTPARCWPFSTRPTCRRSWRKRRRRSSPTSARPSPTTRRSRKRAIRNAQHRPGRRIGATRRAPRSRRRSRTSTTTRSTSMRDRAADLERLHRAADARSAADTRSSTIEASRCATRRPTAVGDPSTRGQRDGEPGSAGRQRRLGDRRRARRACRGRASAGNGAAVRDQIAKATIVSPIDGRGRQPQPQPRRVPGLAHDLHAAAARPASTPS